MPAISFSIMRNETLSGRKKQTVRPKGSGYWLRFSKGARLVGFWKMRTRDRQLLFDSVLAEDPFVVKWQEFTDDLMQRDGFSSVVQANLMWFVPIYGKGMGVIPDMEFVVLRWL